MVPHVKTIVGLVEKSYIIILVKKSGKRLVTKVLINIMKYNNTLFFKFFSKVLE